MIERAVHYSMLAAVATFSLAAQSDAAILAQYVFSGASLASTDTDVNSVAGTWTPSSQGLTLEGVSYFRSDHTTNAEGTSDDFFSFILSPEPGQTINLTSLTFGTAFYGNQVVSGSSSYFVRSSLDGFATSITGVFNETPYQRTTTGSAPFPLPNFTTRTVPLSAPAFQGLTSAITFAIGVFDSTSSLDRRTAVSNIELNGTVVPEPATLSVLALGVASLARRRRA